MIAIYAGAMSITSQAANDLPYFSSSTQIGRIAAAASSVLITSAGNVPSLSQTLPTAVQDNITRLGTVTTGSFPVANLSGTTLPAAVVTSSLTTVGTITSGVWNAGAVTSSGSITAGGANTGWTVPAVEARNSGANASVVAIAGVSGVGGFLTRNAYYDGAWKYSSTDSALRLSMSGGSFAIGLAGSGTGGTAITFTDYLSLSSAGLLTVSGTGIVTTGDMGVAATKKFYFDGVALTGDSYIYEGAANDVRHYVGGVRVLQLKTTSLDIGSETATRTTTYLREGAFGTGAVEGNYLRIGSNRSGNGAAATLQFETKDASVATVWADVTDVLRITAGNSAPTEDNTTVSDTSGTIVGTQTSRLATKNILKRWTDPSDALALVLRTPVVDFTYKNGAYNHSRFTGIVADWSPEFAMDDGRSFNPVSAAGYLILSVQALQRQIDELQAQR